MFNIFNNVKKMGKISAYVKEAAKLPRVCLHRLQTCFPTIDEQYFKRQGPVTSRPTARQGGSSRGVLRMQSVSIVLKRILTTASKKALRH